MVPGAEASGLADQLPQSRAQILGLEPALEEPVHGQGFIIGYHNFQARRKMEVLIVERLGDVVAGIRQAGRTADGVNIAEVDFGGFVGATDRWLDANVFDFEFVVAMEHLDHMQHDLHLILHAEIVRVQMLYSTRALEVGSNPVLASVASPGPGLRYPCRPWTLKPLDVGLRAAA